MIGRICDGCGDIVAGKCPCRSSSAVIRRRVYDSSAWRQRTRPIVIARDRVCVRCGEPGSVVDHVVPIDLLLALGLDPLDPNECQLLCAACSGRKDGVGLSTDMETSLRRRSEHHERMARDGGAAQRRDGPRLA